MWFLVLGLAEVAYTADELSEKRKMNIRCSVHPHFARLLKSVSDFFIFYQPLSGASLARSLLVGCQGEMLWTDLYRIRMFPQFENLLKEKDASCTVGHGVLITCICCLCCIYSGFMKKVHILLNTTSVLNTIERCSNSIHLYPLDLSLPHPTFANKLKFHIPRLTYSQYIM